jgi:hypothetical protein
MTFKEKIDKILRDNKLGINSPTGLEEKVGASVGAINKYYKKNQEPGEGTIKKILDFPGLNKEWWDTGQGPVFLTEPAENPTDDASEATILKSPLHVDKVYKDLVEGNSEYSLIPKTVMAGEYRLILDRDITWRMEIITSLMDAKNQTIKDLRDRLERAEKDLEALRSGLTTIKQG